MQFAGIILAIVYPLPLHAALRQSPPATTPHGIVSRALVYRADVRVQLADGRPPCDSTPSMRVPVRFRAVQNKPHPSFPSPLALNGSKRSWVLSSPRHRTGVYLVQHLLLPDDKPVPSAPRARGGGGWGGGDIEGRHRLGTAGSFLACIFHGARVALGDVGGACAQRQGAEAEERSAAASRPGNPNEGRAAAPPRPTLQHMENHYGKPMAAQIDGAEAA